MNTIKITDLPVASELSSDDILLIIDNPDSNPVAKQLRSGSIASIGSSSSITEAPSNDIIYGRKNQTWVDLTSPANLQFNRGNATEVSQYIPLSGEPVWDESNKSLFVGDGTTTGGILVGRRVVVSQPLVSALSFPSTYSSVVSVELNGNNSTWKIVGSISFFAVDMVDSNVQVNLATSHPDMVCAGSAWVTTPAGTSLKHFSEGEIIMVIGEGEYGRIEFDYLVQLTSSSITFGFPIRRTGGSSSAFLFDDSNWRTRIYAEKLI